MGLKKIMKENYQKEMERQKNLSTTEANRNKKINSLLIPLFIIGIIVFFFNLPAPVAKEKMPQQPEISAKKIEPNIIDLTQNKNAEFNHGDKVVIEGIVVAGSAAQSEREIVNSFGSASVRVLHLDNDWDVQLANPEVIRLIDKYVKVEGFVDKNASDPAFLGKNRLVNAKLITNKIVTGQ